MIDEYPLNTQGGELISAESVYVVWWQMISASSVLKRDIAGIVEVHSDSATAQKQRALLNRHGDAGKSFHVSTSPFS